MNWALLSLAACEVGQQRGLNGLEDLCNTYMQRRLLRLLAVEAGVPSCPTQRKNTESVNGILAQPLAEIEKQLWWLDEALGPRTCALLWIHA